jgi:hypothetical protein
MMRVVDPLHPQDLSLCFPSGSARDHSNTGIGGWDKFPCDGVS